MVIPDWTTRKPTKVEYQPTLGASQSLARPVDRLAAAIVDVFVLVAPIAVLVSSPFRRDLTASLVLGNEAELLSKSLMIGFLAISVLVMYQTLFHFFFQATLGKMLFHLRVVPVFPDGRLSFAASLARSLIWLFELLCFALPFLAVYSNSRRRTLHDRICDTIVVSHSTDRAFTPAIWEKSLARGFLLLCLLLFGSVGLLQVRSLLSGLSSKDSYGILTEAEASGCDSVTDNLDESAGRESRLKVAMALYAAGIVDKSCLVSEIEVERSLRLSVGPLTYLAQAFINSDDAEISNSYLDQVCEVAPESVECAMSEIVSHWSDDDLETVDELIRKSKRGSGYLEVWGVRHFMKQARYPDALTLLDSLNANRGVAEFSMVQRIKALYNSYHDAEASVALAQALPVISKEEAEDVSSWMCAQDLQKGCDSLSQLACRNVNLGSGEIRDIDFALTSEAMAKLLALECNRGTSIDYRTFSESVQDADWKTFLNANQQHKAGKLDASLRLYEEVLTSKTAAEMLKVEAVRRAAQFASSEQLANLHEFWQRLESRETWVKAGNILFSHLAKQSNPAIALNVARELMGAGAMAPQLVTTVDSLNYFAPPPQRLPASEDKPQDQE